MRATPPENFDPETFFSDIDIPWHQQWEIFPGIFTPGRNPIAKLCEKIELPEDLTGKTVLDVGAWHGCLSFECERRGASKVVAYTLESDDESGFSHLKKLLNSKVEYVQGSVYSLDPNAIGTFDIVLFMGVLYHLRYPLLAFDRLRSVCDEVLFSETHVIDYQFENPDTEGQENPLLDLPFWRFYREGELVAEDNSNWCGPNIRAVIDGADSAGFKTEFLEKWGDRATFKSVIDNSGGRLKGTVHYENVPLNSHLSGVMNKAYEG